MIRLPEMRTEAQIVELGKYAGFILAWDRSGPTELEERVWSCSPMRGIWPSDTHLALDHLSTQMLRMYLLGIANTISVANKRLRSIKDFASSPLIDGC